MKKLVYEFLTVIYKDMPITKHTHAIGVDGNGEGYLDCNNNIIVECYSYDGLSYDFVVNRDVSRKIGDYFNILGPELNSYIFDWCRENFSIETR